MAVDFSKYIGKNARIRIFEVEKGSIRRFAEAINDPNPLFRDEEYASATRYGSIICPPGFFGWPLKMKMNEVYMVEFPVELRDALLQDGYVLGKTLDGGIDYEFFFPIRPGDVLTECMVLKDVREKQGVNGKMAFVTLDVKYWNQNGDLVAQARPTAIYRS
jgi:acyl dehydratase